jgi:hypothetical protein
MQKGHLGVASSLLTMYEMQAVERPRYLGRLEQELFGKHALSYLY